MFGSQSWEDDDHISGESVQPEKKSIDDVNLVEKRLQPTAKFVVAFLTGAFFFLFPVQWEGQTTIPLDVLMSLITETSLLTVELFTLAILFAGAILTTVTMLHYMGAITLSERNQRRLQIDYWQTSKPFWAFRVIAIFLAVPMFLGVGPDWLVAGPVSATAWDVLMITIVLVIPLGGIFVNLLAELGGLQFIGTLAQPIMRPLFNLPGRSALDSAASWLGSFSIGYYLTRNVFDRGGYNKREVFVICTCFATANLGTVGAVAAVLDVLHIFPVLILLYLIATLIVAAILVRIPPLSTIPEEYIAEPDPEPMFTGSVTDYFRFAFNEGVRTAEEGKSIPRAAVDGFVDGTKLTAMILGTVLTIATSVLLLEAYTDVFAYLAGPFVPLMTILGIPDPQTAATAVIVGGAEYFIGATLVVEADLLTQVFVVIVTSSQAIFFAASAPMMVDMFDDVPMRFRDLGILLVLRTALLVPIAAGLTHGAAAVGLI
ncbi:YjiH family protein [Haloterrigena alkaliphila]|uniref:YjiH family protein n=1 Tax=Haloterrigena alkaliphila TaxID=2816475 RepID=A0A8A2V7B1_9EURY|nr:nucleoside recognition domain-containing protein [Haloterrigena alkaliphila]QSW97693.1 YjiH family protein [Haloterrigena alkaliphila]